MLIFSIKFSCFHSIYYDDIIGTLYVPSWSVHNNILLHTHPSFTNKRRALLYHYFKTNSQGHILNLIIYTTQKKTDTFPCLGFFYKEFPKLGLFLSYFPGGALLARTLHGKRHCWWRLQQEFGTWPWKRHAQQRFHFCMKTPTVLATWWRLKASPRLAVLQCRLTAAGKRHWHQRFAWKRQWWWRLKLFKYRWCCIFVLRFRFHYFTFVFV